jgi:hypothetical protein
MSSRMVAILMMRCLCGLSFVTVVAGRLGKHSQLMKAAAAERVCALAHGDAAPWLQSC